MEQLRGDFQRRGIEIFFAPLPNCFSGVLRYRKDLRRWFCVINTRKAFVHQRFTLAHELYHFDHHRHLAQLFPVYSTITSYLEREANHGAAEMLMPTDTVKQVWQEARRFFPPERCISIMAERFTVSRAAMRYRLQDLWLVEREVRA